MISKEVGEDPGYGPSYDVEGINENSDWVNHSRSDCQSKSGTDTLWNDFSEDDNEHS